MTRRELKPTDAVNTEVGFTESSAGFLIGTLYTNQRLAAHLQHWLDALRGEAERPA